MQRFYFFDSHAHYDDEGPLKRDRHQVIQSLRQRSLQRHQCYWCKILSVPRFHYTCCTVSVYGSTGIHPGDVKRCSCRLSGTGATNQTTKSGCCRGKSDWIIIMRTMRLAMYKLLLKSHLRLTNQYQLPVIIHDRRSALRDTMDLLKI